MFIASIGCIFHWEILSLENKLTQLRLIDKICLCKMVVCKPRMRDNMPAGWLTIPLKLDPSSAVIIAVLDFVSLYSVRFEQYLYICDSLVLVLGEWREVQVIQPA